MSSSIDVLYVGTFSAGKASLPAGCVADSQIAAGAPGSYVQATKLIHQDTGAASGLMLFGPAVTITALTQTLGMARGAGTLVSFGVWIEVQATGADRTVTIDLQKSTGGGAYATVLTATIGLSNATAVRTLVTAALASAAYVAGDIFRAVVSVAGVAGAQAQGLAVQLIVQENPQ